MINRILVAIDGSATSRRGLDLAAEMAVKFESELILIYVIRDMQVPDGVRALMEADGFQSTRLATMEAIGRQILDEFAAAAEAAGAKKVLKDVRPGDPAGAILRYSSEHNIDLIVMGSRGLGDVESMLLGSVSRKVANLSRVACLTVK